MKVKVKVKVKKGSMFLAAALIMAALVLAGCETPVDEVPIDEETEQDRENTVGNADLDLTDKVTAPVKDTAPVTTAINTAQYRGTVAWQTDDGTAVSETFVADTVYKAVITLTAKSGFTFTGFTGDFTYAGATSVDYADRVVTITFPATAAEYEDTVVNAGLDLTDKVTAPVKNTALVTTWIDTAQFTGAVAWEDANGTAVSGTFAVSTVYQAVITLAAKSGFTFTGFAGPFTYSGATSVNYAGGVVTITFPATAAEVEDTVVNAGLNLASKVTAPVRDAATVTAAIDTAQFTGTVAWQTEAGAAVSGTFAANTVYKAVITLTAKSGFTFTGFAGTFTYSGATSVDYAAGVVTITFPATAKDLAAIRAYLADAGGGTTVNNPVSLPVELNLVNDWAGLLAAIANAGKYVDLDLAACTMTGMTGTEGEFDPGTASTGKDKIVSLVLPDAATSIKAGSDYRNPTFRYFSALESVSGSHIDTVGVWAFSGCTALTTVSLPKATTIGREAFWGCRALTEVDLPEARSIGIAAFQYCSALTTVDLPEATDIGGGAFWECAKLTTVNLPEATTIGENAFEICSALTTVDLPKATTIGFRAFARCAALTTVSLPEATNIGWESFYNCAALTTVSLPEARSISGYAFSGCAALTKVNLPEATFIGEYAFDGCAALTTVTLGSTAPTLNHGMLYRIPAKTVIVKVPNGAEGYGATIPATYSGSNSTLNWGNGFRGGGWTTDSTFVLINWINSAITLVIIEDGP